MANVLLTDSCNRNCPYCFAEKKLLTSGSANLIDFDTLVEIADWSERTGNKYIQLLGGEPTSHPDFAYFLSYLVGREFQIKVFTNAMMPASVRRQIREVIETNSLRHEHLRFIVNVNEPHLRSRSEWQLQRNAFRDLHDNMMLSYNIHHEGASYDFLADIIEEYGLRKTIRFGLAAPILGQKKSGLQIKYYKRVLDELMSFVRRRCFPAGITGSLDCGFPLCFFDDESLGALYRAGFDFKFHCSPAVDIDADKKVWFCFPLAEATTGFLGDHPDLRSLIGSYRKKADEIRKGKGILEDCADCVYKERRLCDGGCMAHYMDFASLTTLVARSS